jgi:hypothetical protein
VNIILLTYKVSQIELLHLLVYQDMMWFIDCWCVHINKKNSRLDHTHPKIHIIYIPTNCTSIY